MPKYDKEKYYVMEDQVTNIAEILKDKPKGTRLYSTELGILRLIEVRCYGSDERIFLKTEDGKIITYLADGKLNPNGKMTLYPSEKIRDWKIFTWKKGDILKCGSAYIVFNGFKNDEYFLTRGNYFVENNYLLGKRRYYAYYENSFGMTRYFVKIEDKLYARKKRKIFKKLAGQKAMTRWRQIKLKNKDKPIC